MTNRSLRAQLAGIMNARERGEGIVVVTVVRNSTPFPLQPGSRVIVSERLDAPVDPDLPDPIVADARSYLRERRSALTSYRWTDSGPEAAGKQGGDLDIFFEVLSKPAGLVVVGAGHIAVPLARIAHFLELHVTVLDDRPEFATAGRFPMADDIRLGPYRQTLAGVAIDADTAIVLVTRGHVHDQACLEQVIDSEARYIGVIGSKRRIRTLLAHLADAGVAPERLRRVHAPIGLDIGARTPAEIALSIMAEIICVQRGGTGRPLTIAEKIYG